MHRSSPVGQHLLRIRPHSISKPDRASTQSSLRHCHKVYHYEMQHKCHLHLVMHCGARETFTRSTWILIREARIHTDKMASSSHCIGWRKEARPMGNVWNRESVGKGIVAAHIHMCNVLVCTDQEERRFRFWSLLSGLPRISTHGIDFDTSDYRIEESSEHSVAWDGFPQRQASTPFFDLTHL